MIKRYDAYVSSPKLKGPRFVDEVECENGTIVQYKDHAAIVVELLGLLELENAGMMKPLHYVRIAELRREYQGEKVN
jgi:hypothetical protein